MAVYTKTGAGMVGGLLRRDLSPAKKWQLSIVPCAGGQRKPYYKKGLNFVCLQQNIIKTQ